MVDARLLAPGYFCLANLLGDVWLAQGTDRGLSLDLSILKFHSDIVDVVIYGKESARSGRKMGHLVSYGATAESAVAAAKHVRTELSRLPAARPSK
jgi:phosphoribosylaminoimidazole carboxylase (NCAIR synthetase)